ncbi:MAG: RNA polymerase subunit sigma-70 [Lachnospiraceae bacterium]|nr:RNA polymerase subunit sigma-70 [Lachnospiraceae bacterium]
MTIEQENRVKSLRGQGYGYATIAKSTGLTKNAVVAFCRKNGLTGCKAKNSRVDVPSDLCLQCGNPIVQIPGRKHIKFCSPACRTAWWNSHPEAVNCKANYSYVCAGCGKAFSAYGNSHRKYCCHECYIRDRYKGGGYDE